MGMVQSALQHDRGERVVDFAGSGEASLACGKNTAKLCVATSTGRVLMAVLDVQVKERKTTSDENVTSPIYSTRISSRALNAVATSEVARRSNGRLPLSPPLLSLLRRHWRYNRLSFTSFPPLGGRQRVHVVGGGTVVRWRSQGSLPPPPTPEVIPSCETKTSTANSIPANTNKNDKNINDTPGSNTNSNSNNKNNNKNKNSSKSKGNERKKNTMGDGFVVLGHAHGGHETKPSQKRLLLIDQAERRWREWGLCLREPSVVARLGLRVDRA